MEAGAGEYAVDESDAGCCGGNEGADLGHEGDDGDLAEVGGFTRHVGAGDDGDGALCCEGDIVGDERLIEHGFNDGVAGGGGFNGAGVVDLWAG